MQVTRDSIRGLVVAVVVIVITITVIVLLNNSQTAPVMQTSQSESSPTTTAQSYTMLCNGAFYPACPAGQDFVCPASGNAFCQPSSQQTSDPQSLKNQDSPGTDGGYSTIAAEWSKRVAQVVCSWNYQNGTSQTLTGSALLVNMQGLGVAAVTNKHVISDNNGYSPNGCVVGIYKVGTRIVGQQTGTDGPYAYASDGRDWGIIKLSAKYTTFAYDNGIFDVSTSSHLKVCSEGDAGVGDKVIVLGYPTIGTNGGITVTDGIVSGIESDYYVTDAKIDHGNSGGAAVLVKDDCYLGIPTWAANNGGFESLGRVLKSTFPLNP